MASKYDEYGFTRYTIILHRESKEILEKLAKDNKITQSEVLSILLAQNSSNLKGEFEKKRTEKLRQRQEAKSMSLKLKDLSPEQIAEINKVIGK